jgi:hypothetical protein
MAKFREHVSALFIRAVTFPKLLIMAIWLGISLTMTVVLKTVADVAKDKAETYAADWAAGISQNQTARWLLAKVATLSVRYPTTAVVAAFLVMVLIIVAISALQIRGGADRTPSLGTASLAPASSSPALVPQPDEHRIDAGNLLVFLETIKLTTPPLPTIKLVAIPMTEDFAELLARCLKLMGYGLVDNPDTGGFVFFARTANQQLLVRSRDGASLDIARLTTTRLVLMKGLERLKLPLPVYTGEFPDNERYNYVQIELCGSL